MRRSGEVRFSRSVSLAQLDIWVEQAQRLEGMAAKAYRARPWGYWWQELQRLMWQAEELRAYLRYRERKAAGDSSCQPGCRPA